MSSRSIMRRWQSSASMVGYWEGALALQKAGRSLEEDAHLVLKDKEISHDVSLAEVFKLHVWMDRMCKSVVW